MMFYAMVVLFLTAGVGFYTKFSAMDPATAYFIGVFMAGLGIVFLQAIERVYNQKKGK